MELDTVIRKQNQVQTPNSDLDLDLLTTFMSFYINYLLCMLTTFILGLL